ncbi:MAG: hypothetical protein WAV15_02440 [Minisyncoccia bacterium]
MKLNFWDSPKSPKGKPIKKVGVMKINLQNNKITQRPKISQKSPRRALETKPVNNFDGIEELHNMVGDVEKAIFDAQDDTYERLYTTAEVNIKNAQMLLERLKDTHYEGEHTKREQEREVARLGYKIRELKSEVEPINTEAIAAEKAEMEEIRVKKIAEIRARIAAFTDTEKNKDNDPLIKKEKKMAEIRERMAGK